MVTEAKLNQREAGLRILARMIVRAYLGEIARGEAGPAAYQEKEMEVKYANKRCNRGNQASQAGQNQAGQQKGKRRRD